MTSTVHEQTLKAIEDFVITREKKKFAAQEMIQRLVNDSENINKNWTLTQLHIVSVIHESKQHMNNTLLSMELNISKATISKAIRVLIDNKILLTHQNIDNKKEIFYTLTDEGIQLAIIHKKLHKIAHERYNKLFQQFNDTELQVITNFLESWKECI
ncbi:MarR family transcriptional regulator [Bacillus thuringiensis serovar roskildiensis]|uniref:MarR family transcriptional regulator n=1 Tax=Bacillus thuringiensis serovar sooncheon TaxID=180891 RepID=A0A9Q5SHZ2_BACTU|nr:MarR family transcriptional regulator [Bacillus thuringiensis]MEB9661625.1 MarR family transcriptional regulator [Bacillus cereus]ARV91120.1 MarR family transcriptional regulator [Bacillus thuringiensis]OTW68809.1 MarR family transcriptional regulator [Bacillus thuringiensis serovar coreanensis]OTX42695.1 MarR family transcriptional regulator [Bacillus thuringiensis serovar sooncheon]OTX54417.1 MarR family transcriptional regulator [Bacillus thuringiensis serovar guiyangiensis]